MFTELDAIITHYPKPGYNILLLHISQRLNACPRIIPSSQRLPCLLKVIAADHCSVFKDCLIFTCSTAKRNHWPTVWCSLLIQTCLLYTYYILSTVQQSYTVLFDVFFKIPVLSQKNQTSTKIEPWPFFAILLHCTTHLTLHSNQ